MKALPYTALAAFIGFTHANAALTSGLVAYYNFDQAGAAGLVNHAPGASGTDASWTNAPVNGSTGFTGNATFNPGNGISDRSSLLVGNAINFVDGDGGNTIRVLLPFSSADLGQSFSISMWHYLAPGVDNLSNRYQAIEAANNYDVSWGTDSSYSSNADYVGYAETAKGTELLGILEETWNHVVLQYDLTSNSTLNVYVNGTLRDTVTDTSGTFSFTGLHLGGSRDGSVAAIGDRDWDGMMDEVALWDRSLTSDEVTSLYNAGLSGIAVTAVPEPSSAALLGLSSLGLMLRRRR
ncbi:LamG domain-containing protein [Rubritalea tangerina]|uniref:LamG domain-containing protein n=1 Tax=Rubritalea tangerina TaxID=430798 RepID=A0ABW4ZCR9_9BACT